MTEQPGANELRQRILDAGRTVFAEVGYGAATVDDVIVAAGTSRASFYRYFDNKQALFNELGRACFHDVRQVVSSFRSLPEGVSPSTIEEILRQYRDLHARHVGVFRAWWERSTERDPALRKDGAATMDRLLDVLEAAVRDAAAPSSLDPQVRAILLYLLVDQTYFAVSSRWSWIDPDRVAPTLATMVHRSFFAGTIPERSTRLRAD